MARYSGFIGYAIPTEIRPGVWDDTIVRRKYRGDVLQQQQRWNQSDKVNDEQTISNRLSIISDPFAIKHIQNIKFVEWMGTLWEVDLVEIFRPRLIMSIRGVYNGPTGEETGITPDSG